jgi:hypothetical protein
VWYSQGTYIYLGGFIMKKILVLAVALACSVPAFAFTSTQTSDQVKSEVASRVKADETLESIAAAAKAAGVAVDPVAIALVIYGTYDKVLAGLMTAGYDAAGAVNALVAAGGNRSALQASAISKGASPDTLLPATAAGSTTGVAAISAAFAGTPFAASRSSTVGGGGSSGVSPN